MATKSHVPLWIEGLINRTIVGTLAACAFVAFGHDCACRPDYRQSAVTLSRHCGGFPCLDEPNNRASA
jgi:hypothetical protein